MYSTGAIAIGKKLKEDKCTIEELRMSYNNFGDNGIDVIANSINEKIKTLCISKCGITYNGAESLSKLLSVNQNITELKLFDNNITVMGARLILQSAINNKACKVDIAIDNSYQSDPKVARMLNTLKERRENTNWGLLQVSYVTTVIIKIVYIGLGWFFWWFCWWCCWCCCWWSSWWTTWNGFRHGYRHCYRCYYRHKSHKHC